MYKFIDHILEKFANAYKKPKVGTVEVFENPTWDEWKEISDNPDRLARGFYDHETNSVYAWDAWKAAHYDIREQFPEYYVTSDALELYIYIDRGVPVRVNVRGGSFRHTDLLATYSGFKDAEINWRDQVQIVKGVPHEPEAN